METLYNVDLGVNNRHPACPKDLYEKTIELLHEKGLLGIKQINKYGEMGEGYDKNCRDFRKAFFDVHYNATEERSAPEILDHLRLTSSSEDDLAQEVSELGDAALEVIAKTDPSIGVIPWNIYTSFPYISSLEIMTPAGRQSLHYHTEDGRDFGVMQLWKPKKGNQFYVLDELKRTLGDLSMEDFGIWTDITNPEKKLGVIEKLKLRKRSRSLNKASKVYKQFLINPNNVKRFPSFIKSL